MRIDKFCLKKKRAGGRRKEYEVCLKSAVPLSEEVTGNNAPHERNWGEIAMIAKKRRQIKEEATGKEIKHQETKYLTVVALKNILCVNVEK